MHPQYQQAPQPGYQQQPYPNQGYQQPMVGHNQPNYGNNQPTPAVYYMVPAEQMHAIGFQPVTNQPPQEDLLQQKSGFERLNGVTGICVSQVFEPCKLVGGCDTENRYLVHTLNGNTRGDTLLFMCKERTLSCARCCLGSSCRSFKTTILKASKAHSDQYEPFLELERPCSGLCLFSNGELSIRLVENGKNEYLGKIGEPFSLCTMQANIYDKDKSKKYSLSASCCQPAACCRWPCDASCCSAVDFHLRTPSGEAVSKIEKKVKGCCCKPFSGGNYFKMNFPSNSAPVDKALMMASVLLMDYSKFETPAIVSDGDVCDCDC